MLCSQVCHTYFWEAWVHGAIVLSRPCQELWALLRGKEADSADGDPVTEHSPRVDIIGGLAQHRVKE